MTKEKELFEKYQTKPKIIRAEAETNDFKKEI